MNGTPASNTSYMEGVGMEIIMWNDENFAKNAKQSAQNTKQSAQNTK